MIADDRRTIHEPARQTPVRAACDVLIVGGGTAGFVAALAAARNGADTILVEKYGTLGGAMINGATALHSFFNMYKAFPDVERIQLIQGIPQEIVDRMQAAGGSPGHLEMSDGFDYDTVATCFDHEVFKLVAFDMLEEAGVKLLLHTTVVDAITHEDSIQGVVIQSISGREAIAAKVVVDCSGDGTAAHLAGAKSVLDADLPHSHAVALTFGLGGVELPRAVEYLEREGMISQLVRGYKGSDTDDIIRIGFKLDKNPVFARKMEEIGTWGPLSVSLHEGELTYVNTTRATNINPADVEDMTKAEIALRRQVAAMTRFMRENLPGFEKAYVSWTSMQVGVRRTRVIECEVDLTIDDVESARRFEDEVVLYGFHDMAPRRMIKDGAHYGIPYRALLPKGVENLLVAGKLITSDWIAHMSTRNTVSCMAQGQAVGTAAAMSARQGIPPRQLDTELLRSKLQQDGAFLDA